MTAHGFEAGASGSQLAGLMVRLFRRAGAELPAQLVGSYSLCIFDSHHQRVLAARSHDASLAAALHLARSPAGSIMIGSSADLLPEVRPWRWMLAVAVLEADAGCFVLQCTGLPPMFADMQVIQACCRNAGTWRPLIANVMPCARGGLSFFVSMVAALNI